MRAAFGFLATLTLTAFVHMLLCFAIAFGFIICGTLIMFGSVGDVFGVPAGLWLVAGFIGALGLLAFDLSAGLVAVLLFIRRRQFLLALGVVAGWWLGLGAAALFYPR